MSSVVEINNSIKGIKVAHFAVFGPGRSGQYATVKDLILAEREQGIDAQFVDCAVCGKCMKNEGCEGKIDGPIKTVSMDWASNADILVRHSVIPVELEGMGKPIIICLHGRPENSFLLEKYKQMPIISFLRDIAGNDRYKAVVTFWEEHLSFFSTMIPEKKVHYVPSMVDLVQYNPEGPKRDYSTRRGNPNIMIADMWREDTTPFNVLFAAVEFIQKYCKTGRIHLYGVPSDSRGPVNRIITQLSTLGVLGDVCTMTPNMQEQYRAADFLVTPHVISTRIVREALACGTSIIAGSGNPYTLFTGNPRDTSGFAEVIRKAWETIKIDPELPTVCRNIAKQKFSFSSAGRKMVEVIESVVNNERAIKLASHKEDDRITFAFSAYGDKFIDNVFTLLQSIDTLYKGSANIVFYYHNIDPGYIEEIQNLLPYVILKESRHADCEKGDVEYKTAQKSLIWSEMLEDNKNFDNVVLLDADTMLVRKMGKFFLDEFDVGFCYKGPNDENPQWPINGGVMLVRNSELVRKFLLDWSNLTIETQKAGESAKRNGYDLWGGGDQVSLGYILGTRNVNSYKKGLVIDTLKFKGYSMEYFNESRGIIPSDKTHLIHYKGESWQSLLRSSVFSKRRPNATCGVLYDMNRKVFNKWRERANKYLGKWSPEFEMKYWNARNDDDGFYIKDIKRLYDEFDVDKFIVDNIDTSTIKNVVEVGGGAYGGALRFFPLSVKKYAIDLSMDLFLKKGKIPKSISCIKADFSDIPINSGTAEVVFAWEVLDHALTDNHFYAGIDELCRIMRPGAVLFFNQPLHSEPRNGHTVVKTKAEIIAAFVSRGLEVRKANVINNTMKHVPEEHKEICLTIIKPLVVENVSDLVSSLDGVQ